MFGLIHLIDLFVPSMSQSLVPRDAKYKRPKSWSSESSSGAVIVYSACDERGKKSIL